MHAHTRRSRHTKTKFHFLNKLNFDKRQKFLTFPSRERISHPAAGKAAEDGVNHAQDYQIYRAHSADQHGVLPTSAADISEFKVEEQHLKKFED